MENKQVEHLVENLTELIEALPDRATPEPLEFKAWESEGVFRTVYSREYEMGRITEYLDVYFKDDQSHVLVIADSERYLVVVSPDRGQNYTWERFISIMKEH